MTTERYLMAKASARSVATAWHPQSSLDSRQNQSFSQLPNKRPILTAISVRRVNKA
jgi:hypothetical protein